MLNSSLGIYLMIFNIIFTMIWIVSFKTNVALNIVFAGVSIGVFLLGAMYCACPPRPSVQASAYCDIYLRAVSLSGSGSYSVALSKSGGAFLFLSASSGFYITFAQRASAFPPCPLTYFTADMPRHSARVRWLAHRAPYGRSEPCQLRSWPPQECLNHLLLDSSK